MRIPIRSLAQAEQLNARLAHALAAVGEARDPEFVRVSLPAILGYASWPDLAEHVDPNCSPVRKLDLETHRARQNAVRSRVMNAFAISRLKSLIVVADLAGKGENTEKPCLRLPQRDPAAALKAATHAFSRSDLKISPIHRGEKSGFLASEQSRPRSSKQQPGPDIEVLTDTEGRYEIVLRNANNGCERSVSAGWLYRYPDQIGLSSKTSPINPLVTATLKRLDWLAITRLHGHDDHTTDDYERVRHLSHSSALADFLDRHPMLANIALRTPPSCDSTNTTEAVADLVRDYAIKEWPDHVPTQAGIMAAIGAWSGAGITECYDFGIYEVALLAYCLQERHPRDPEQLRGVVTFGCVTGDIFAKVGNMTVTQFFSDFDGDWVRLCRIVDGFDPYSSDYEPISNFVDITRLVLAAQLVQSGRDADGTDEIECLDPINEALMQRVFAGHSFETMLARYADFKILEIEHTAKRWCRTPSDDAETVRQEYAALLASEMLPPDLRMDNPADLLAKIGFDASQVLADADLLR